MDILTKVSNTMIEYNLVQKGELILAAVSGGPDSLAMLEILFRLKEEFNYRLHVVHLNHKLRPEATLEAEFVRDFATQKGIPATIFEADLGAIVEEGGSSLQNQAREVRYQLFSQLAEEIGAQKIALGHHADDLAETILMRFLRGAGLEGLVGFRAQSRQRLIRPLIDLTRQEIEDFCQELGLEPRRDASNDKPVYLRNQIRLELIPLLEKEFNPNLRSQLVQMSQIFTEENQVLEELAQKEFAEIVLKVSEDIILFDINLLKKKNSAILRRIIRLGMEKLKGDKKDFYFHHYQQMQELILTGSPGKRLDLPNGYILYRGYRELKLGTREAILPDTISEYDLPIPGRVYLQEVDQTIEAILVDETVPLYGKDRAVIDANEVQEHLLIRSRRSGDWFCPLGLGGRKKIKDFFIDEKIDRLERDLIPIVTTDTGDIVWIPGYRLDERFKVNRKTTKKCILKIFKGGKKNA